MNRASYDATRWSRLRWAAYKGLIGERLRSRGNAARRTEAVVGAAVLNRMLDVARPNSVRRSVAPA